MNGILEHGGVCFSRCLFLESVSFGLKSLKNFANKKRFRYFCQCTYKSSSKIFNVFSHVPRAVLLASLNADSLDTYTNSKMCLHKSSEWIISKANTPRRTPACSSASSFPSSSSSVAKTLNFSSNSISLVSRGCAMLTNFRTSSTGRSCRTLGSLPRTAGSGSIASSPAAWGAAPS